MEVIIDGVRYAPIGEKQDKPTEQPKDTVMLYCTADCVGTKSLKKGDTCQWSETESKIIFPNGQRSNMTYSSWKQFFDINLGYAQAKVVPLVQRPAKVGEWVLMVRDDCIGINKKGDLVRALGNDFLFDKTDKHIQGISAIPGEHYYLVLDGYQPEPEKCKCCGQVIKE